jgi:hypothetical protein
MTSMFYTFQEIKTKLPMLYHMEILATQFNFNLSLTNGLLILSIFDEFAQAHFKDLFIPCHPLDPRWGCRKNELVAISS